MAARMTEDYIRSVGRLAYLWGWPLVNMRNRPDQAILDGTWTPPPVTRLGLAG